MICFTQRTSQDQAQASEEKTVFGWSREVCLLKISDPWSCSLCRSYSLLWFSTSHTGGRSLGGCNQGTRPVLAQFCYVHFNYVHVSAVHRFATHLLRFFQRPQAPTSAQTLTPDSLGKSSTITSILVLHSGAQARPAAVPDGPKLGSHVRGHRVEHGDRGDGALQGSAVIVLCSPNEASRTFT